MPLIDLNIPDFVCGPFLTKMLTIRGILQTVSTHLAKHAGVNIVCNYTKALGEHARMVKQGRKPGDTKRIICIPADVWYIMATVTPADNEIIRTLLGIGAWTSFQLPIVLQPCLDRIKIPQVRRASIGDSILVDMDGFVPGKPYTVELVNADGTTVEDSAAGTAGDAASGGAAQETLVVPSGYVPSTAIIRIKQTVATTVEFPNLSVDIEHDEDYVIQIV